MMSQQFNISQVRSPTQDFIMMNNNNNYLPGVSRLSEGFQIPLAPLGPQTTVPGVDITTSPVLAVQAAGMNCALDSTGIMTNVADNVPHNSQLDLTGTHSLDSQVKDLSSSPAGIEVEMNPPDLCEHQGPLSSNLSQISGWSSSSYNIGTKNPSVSNFTFTTPTQSYLHSPALTATTQFHNTRLRPQTFAPGCNAQWKHSVPRKMPWLPHSSVSCPQGLSVFTGIQSSGACSIPLQAQHIAGTSTLYSPQMYQPVASCSELTRRHKRRHTVDSIGEECPNNKIHLTEDKIARHMKDLRIHNISPPPSSVLQPGDHVDTSQGGILSVGGDPMSDTCYPGQNNHNTCNNEFLRHSQRQWHDFKLLEEKLQMIDEDTTSDNEDTSKREPVLHIVDGINVTPKEVLPRHIIDRIKNPCQEIVLWSPQIVPDKGDDDLCEDTCNDNNTEQTDMMEAQFCEDKVLEDSGMETDPDDEDL